MSLTTPAGTTLAPGTRMIALPSAFSIAFMVLGQALRVICGRRFRSDASRSFTGEVSSRNMLRPGPYATISIAMASPRVVSGCVRGVPERQPHHGRIIPIDVQRQTVSAATTCGCRGRGTYHSHSATRGGQRSKGTSPVWESSFRRNQDRSRPAALRDSAALGARPNTSVPETHSASPAMYPIPPVTGSRRSGASKYISAMTRT